MTIAKKFATTPATLQFLAELNHDLLVAMQAAYIEWKHGKGADSAMSWIVGTLSSAGLVPNERELYGTEAQAWFDSRRAVPLPTCRCGKPSSIVWMGQGFCCQAHFAAAKAKSLN